MKKYLKSCYQQILEDQPHLKRDANFLVLLKQQLCGLPVVCIVNNNIPLGGRIIHCANGVKKINIECSVQPSSKVTTLNFHINIPSQEWRDTSSLFFNFKMSAHTQEIVNAATAKRRRTTPLKHRVETAPSKTKSQETPEKPKGCVEQCAEAVTIVEELHPIRSLCGNLTTTLSSYSTPKVTSTSDNFVSLGTDNNVNNFNLVNYITDENDQSQFEPEIIISEPLPHSFDLMADNSGALISDSIYNSNLVDARIGLNIGSDNELLQDVVSSNSECSVSIMEISEAVSSDVTREPAGLHKTTLVKYGPAIDMSEDLDRNQLEISMEDCLNFEETYDINDSDGELDFQPSLDTGANVDRINVNSERNNSDSAKSTHCLSVLDVEMLWHDTLDYEVDDNDD